MAHPAAILIRMFQNLEKFKQEMLNTLQHVYFLHFPQWSCIS